MKLENAKFLYVTICLALGVIILSPSLFALVPLPEGERFTELWLLGPNHMIEMGAVDLLLNQPYTFYLGVSNHMADLEHYTVYVKLLNQSEAVEETLDMPSSLESVFEYHLFLGNNETWEESFVFSFENVSFEENVSRVSMVSINGYNVSVDKSVLRDELDGRFYCQMLFELWIYNSTISAFQYHDRFVGFWIDFK